MLEHAPEIAKLIVIWSLFQVGGMFMCVSLLMFRIVDIEVYTPSPIYAGRGLGDRLMNAHLLSVVIPCIIVIAYIFYDAMLR